MKAIEPFDPRCERLARDMNDYDSFLDLPPKHKPNAKGNARVAFVINEEGTYNPVNGHFLCDSCYMAEGQPSSPNGWKCP